MFNRDKATINLLIDLIDKILKQASPFANCKELVKDNRTLDAILLLFMVVGEQISKITSKFKQINQQIDWRRIESYKNLSDNDYFGFDETKVWNIIQNDLPRLREQLKIIANQEVLM